MLQTLEQTKAGEITSPAVPFGKEKKDAADCIAVLGSHPATVMMAPFEDEGTLIYACSPHNVEHRTLPRVDEWFELHNPIADKTRAYGYLRTIENLPLVWMRDTQAMKFYPGARAYPQKELCGELEVDTGGIPLEAYIRNLGVTREEDARALAKCLPIVQPNGRTDAPHILTSRVKTVRPGKFSWFSFTSSIAYMLAKAIDDCEKHDIGQIDLYGIMQASNVEYQYQKPGIQNLIWEATKRGIRINAPDISLLFEPPVEQW